MNQEEILRYCGKLLLANETPSEQTPSVNNFTKIPSIKRNLFFQECIRCGNQKTSLFGRISCTSCGRTHLYCRNCIEMGRVMECESLYYWSGPQVEWPRYESSLTWDGTLTEYQMQASNRIVQAVQQKERELLTWAVCGAGKTEMLFQGIEEGLKAGMRICIATPRADVVRELKPRIQAAFQNVPVQALYGGSEDKDGSAQLIIATTHQLLRFYKTFDVIIIDEVDAFPYHHDETLPFAVNRAKKDIHTTIYLTATPRKDLQLKIALHRLPHVFVPVRYHGYPLPVPLLKMCFSFNKNRKEDSFLLAIKKWLKTRRNPRRQLLLFVPTISMAENLVEKMQTLVEFELTSLTSVHAEDPLRIEKIDRFRNKEIDVLITTTILERGVTFPSVDVVVLDAGHKVFDEAALVQIAGRAGRSVDDPTGEVVFLHEGKTEAMVKAVRSIGAMNKRGGFTL